MVAGVEVSTDGGTTWHPAPRCPPANTSVTWTYTWVAHGNPTTTIESRAVDDSGNLEKPRPGITVNVNCPCSIWGNGGHASDHRTPVTRPRSRWASSSQTDNFGIVTGIRFYKASTNTGTHIGNLWTCGRPAAGQRDLHRRDQPPAGSRSTSHSRCRSTRTPPTSRPTSRPRGTTRRTTLLLHGAADRAAAEHA